MRKTYKGQLQSLPDNGIFVFGSNTQGRHGKGAAKTARDKFGAEYGKAFGLQGRSFGIITKDLTKDKHPSVGKIKIVCQILFLYLFAEQNKDKEFYIAYMDKPNLNGYSSEQMADMFNLTDCKIPDNIIFEESFYKLIAGDKNS